MTSLVLKNQNQAMFEQVCNLLSIVMKQVRVKEAVFSLSRQTIKYSM